MTRKDNSVGMRGVARNVQAACLRIARLLTGATSAILEGDNFGAMAALNEARQINFDILAVQGKIADGLLSEAELLSEGMNAAPKKGQQKGTKTDAQKSRNGGVKS